MIVSLVSLLQDAASELLYPLLPILLTTVLGAPAAVVGAVEGIAEGVAAGTKVVAGRLSDRWRKVPIVGLGYGLAALGKVLVAAASVWRVVLLGRWVDRLGKGIRGAPRDALLVVDIPRSSAAARSVSTRSPRPGAAGGAAGPGSVRMRAPGRRPGHARGAPHAAPRGPRCRPVARDPRDGAGDPDLRTPAWARVVRACRALSARRAVAAAGVAAR